MSINKKLKSIESDLCPMYNSKPETIQHLISCTHPDMTMARDRALRRMFQIINTLNTQKHIVSFWRSLFQSIAEDKTVPKPLLTMELTPWGVIQTYHQQKAIVWESFSKGLLVKKSSELQQQHYVSYLVS